MKKLKFVEAMIGRADDSDVDTEEATTLIEKLSTSAWARVACSDEACQARAVIIRDLVDEVQGAIEEITPPWTDEHLSFLAVGTGETISEQIERAGLLVADEVAIIKLSDLKALIANQKTESVAEAQEIGVYAAI